MSEEVVHIMPVDDLIEHEESADCICGPIVDNLFKGDVLLGKLIVHCSLDGREQDEDTVV